MWCGPAGWLRDSGWCGSCRCLAVRKAGCPCASIGQAVRSASRLPTNWRTLRSSSPRVCSRRITCSRCDGRKPVHHDARRPAAIVGVGIEGQYLAAIGARRAHRLFQLGETALGERFAGVTGRHRYLDPEHRLRTIFTETRRGLRCSGARRAGTAIIHCAGISPASVSPTSTSRYCGGASAIGASAVPQELRKCRARCETPREDR